MLYIRCSRKFSSNLSRIGLGFSIYLLLYLSFIFSFCQALPLGEAYNPKEVESGWYEHWEKEGFFKAGVRLNGEKGDEKRPSFMSKPMGKKSGFTLMKNK